MTFERFGGRFSLDGRLRVLSGLHVGTLAAQAAVASDRPVVRDALGQPFIPGASLKGALRAEVERIVRTVRPARACNPAGDDSERCVPRDRWQAMDRTTGGADDPTVGRLLADTCWTCRLFGAPWLASRVQVADLAIDPETWLGHLPVRGGAAVDRDTEVARPGLRHDYEIVPPGAEFRCQVRADTDDPRWLGMLALGLRELAAGRLALGGGRSRGLGRVQLVVDRQTLVGRDADSLLAFLGDPDAGGAAVDEAATRGWVAAVLDCLRADALPEEAG